MIKLLLKLWLYIEPRRRWQLFGILVLMMICAFSEILSIGAIFPFLAALTSPGKAFQSQLMQPIIELLSLTKPEQLLYPLTLFFATSALFAGFVRILLLWVVAKVSFDIGADLGLDLYRKTLYQPYQTHCSRNSSEIVSAIFDKSRSIITNIVLPAMTVVSSIIMMLAILIMLVFVNYQVALLVFGGFGFVYLVIAKITRGHLMQNSKSLALETVNVLKALQEGLAGIKDILIDGSQEVYCRIYSKADIEHRRAEGSNSFISASPRFAMEALGMVLISVTAYFFVKRTNDASQVIPVLGALALGAQRLLPVLQQAYSSLTNMRGWQIPLQQTIELLNQKLPNHLNKPKSYQLKFNKTIALNKVCFMYSNEEIQVLNNVTLNILKGERIGFIGSTGGGKSTLLDIVMGLLEPTKGSLEIDGIKITSENSYMWQANISHVPQAIFLADSSVTENIAFGIPKELIDHQKVRRAAESAQISKTIESLPQKYETYVGERGVRLSGGQRQRIGIARALYKQAQVIIFDEATSALDQETEASVMQAIDQLSSDLTILIVAHRLTTLKGCTKIVELSMGRISRVGTYDEIVGLSKAN